MRAFFVAAIVAAAGTAVNVAFYADDTSRWWSLAAAVFCGATLGLLEHRTRRRPSWDRHVGGALDVLGTRRAHDDLDRRWP